MLPSLFSVGSYPVSTYGLLFSIAHLAGIGLVLWLARRRGQAIEPYVDLIFVTLVAGLLGGRAFYVWEFRVTDPTEWPLFWRGGLSSFGSLLGGLTAAVIFLARRKIPFWPTADLLSPVLTFSLGLVRLGCLAAGCCYGLPTALPWGVHPTSPLTPPELAGLALHPTQAYEALFLFSLAGFLFWLLGQKERAPGTVVSAFALAYGAYRLSTNHLRADLTPWLGGWSVAEVGAALLFLAGLGFGLWCLRRGRGNHETIRK
jgi:phosphatidylglycerol:prolipoprotein diacylglycerol transferase